MERKDATESMRVGRSEEGVREGSGGKGRMKCEEGVEGRTESEGKRKRQ